MNVDEPSALLVTDAAGQIIDRIGRSWQRHARGVRFHVVRSSETHAFACCRQAAERGLVHWLDPWRFRVCGGAVAAPQVVMVHHLVEADMPAMRRLLRHADAVTVVSRRWQTRLEGWTEGPVLLTPNSVPCDVFRPVEGREELRRAAGIADSSFVLGFLGKVRANRADRKGTTLLLQVLEAAAAKWRDLELLLAGPGWDALAKQIAPLGLPVRRLEFATTEETVAAYALMDVLLVTSSEEGGPCTVLEAMACGVPVVTSDVGHVPEVIADGETGLLCANRTAGEYLERLGKLRADAPFKSRLAAQARRFVERERDDSVLVPRLDLAGLYSRAAARFRERSFPQLARRRVRYAAWAVRHTLRQMFRRA